MHKNTKRLRTLMQQAQLKAKDVADITRRETSTVHVWRCKTTTRVIPDELLQLVELTVAMRQPSGAVHAQ